MHDDEDDDDDDDDNGVGVGGGGGVGTFCSGRRRRPARKPREPCYWGATMATMEGEEEEEEKKEEQEDDYDEEEEEEEERRADKSWPLVNEHWLATVSGVLSLSFSSSQALRNLLSVSLCPATSAFVPFSLSLSPTALASSGSVLNE